MATLSQRAKDYFMSVFGGKEVALEVIAAINSSDAQGNLTTATTGVTVTGGTGAVIGSGTAIDIQTATGSVPGLISAADWTTFNGKQSTGQCLPLAGGTVTGNLILSGAQAYPVIQTTNTPGATTATINWSLGNTATLDLTSASGDVVVTMTNGQNGGCYTLHVVQGAGSRNATFTAKWPGGVAPTITTTNGGIDIISFTVRGGLYYGCFNQAFA